MSNIYNSQKLNNLKEESEISNILNKSKKLNLINSTPLIRQKINYDILSQKNIDNYNNIHNIKHSLFLKKINLKENKNKYYVEGVYNLFNNENVFLNNIYKGRKIVIGKSRNKSSINLYTRRNKKYTTKRTFIKPKTNNVSSNNITNITKINNTYTNESLAQNIKGRKMLWIGKKNGNYITDEELKNIYQECINRESKGLKKITLKSKNKNFNYNNHKSLSEKDSNNIINLQSLALDKYQLRSNETKKMIDRLLKYTSKKEDNLLINQINNYRLKKEKIDEEDINNIINNNPNFKSNKNKEVEKQLIWLISLREYKNNIVINNRNRRTCPSPNNRKNILSKQKYLYSFDKRDKFFDLSGQFNPLFAQIVPKIYNEKEKIRDTLSNNKNDNNINLIVDNSFYNNKKISDLYKDLNIKGKKLINFEMELSKELEGKKKKIVQFPYKEDEITTKIFAKSYSAKNFDAPKSIRNTFELHYNNK